MHVYVAHHVHSSVCLVNAGDVVLELIEKPAGVFREAAITPAS